MLIVLITVFIKTTMKVIKIAMEHNPPWADLYYGSYPYRRSWELLNKSHLTTNYLPFVYAFLIMQK
jgi:hypothetical protein